MKIRQIDVKDHREVDWFINFPYHLYKQEDLWIPPLLDEARNQIVNHPFYEHSQAAFFVVETGPPPTGDVLGRIAVMDNRRYNVYAQSSSAFVGFFETTDDSQVSGLLFDAVFDWASMQGLKEILGPHGLSYQDGRGILINGFEHPPVYNVPFNFPYYEKHLTGAGFLKDTDFHSGYLALPEITPEKYSILAERAMRRRYLWVKSVSSKPEMNEWLPQIMQVQIEAYKTSHLYYSPTEKEIQYQIDAILAFGAPGLLKILMDREKVVGYILGYLDISKAIKKTHGRLLPFGWYTVLQETKHTRRIYIHQLGILPTHRNMGGDILLYLEMLKTFLANNYEHIGIIQVNEKTIANHSDFGKLGVHWNKTHRTYRKDLT
jgi:ribosomal protein S18 acetylase RimI-like enzyme